MISWVGMCVCLIPMVATIVYIICFKVPNPCRDIEEAIEREKRQLKKITEKQIKDIHSRGKITPAEALEEWEKLDLCAPGDVISGDSARCKTFNNCHDCLVDYANKHDEYISLYNLPKYKLEEKSDT